MRFIGMCETTPSAEIVILRSLAESPTRVNLYTIIAISEYSREDFIRLVGQSPDLELVNGASQVVIGNQVLEFSQHTTIKLVTVRGLLRSKLDTSHIEKIVPIHWPILRFKKKIFNLRTLSPDFQKVIFDLGASMARELGLDHFQIPLSEILSIDKTPNGFLRISTDSKEPAKAIEA